MAAELAGKRILLIIAGGIAAYKSLDLIRRLRERGAEVRVIMSEAAQKFVTRLAAGSLAGGRVYTDLFDPSDEFDVGHIRLARDCDLVVVAPATADLMAKAAHGLAPDLASAVLLATNKPVLMAPAMNPRMWSHLATQRNLRTLLGDGVAFVGPAQGEMAEAGESGVGRMSEPTEIVEAVVAWLAPQLFSPGKPGSHKPLAGKRVLVTSGPTQEPIDPVRFISNRSSGKQGYAIAGAAAAQGADVIVVTGPVNLPDPPGVKTIKIETAEEMLKAVESSLPADVAICAAAVADWRVAHPQGGKIKKNGKTPQLTLTENPDILAALAGHKELRPHLVIGFAAETDQVVEHAKEKLARKRCDWIVANDVSPAAGVFGGAQNTVHLVTRDGVESWPTQSKEGVARELVARIVAALGRAK
jgi:phosphopantothenoylcysteine decarboxylase/phosphopantothenate--cysteine ligase